MLTIVFDNPSKEEALKMRDMMCTSLVGVPGFIENDIIVNTQDIDKDTKKPLNEDGELVCVEPETGKEYKHCVRLIINSTNQKDDVQDVVIFA